MDCSPPGSSVHGISKVRILEWVANFFSRGLPGPGIKPESPALAGGFFPTEPPGKPPFFEGELTNRLPISCGGLGRGQGSEGARVSS